jgi:pimeloyl-ACP methyl ester carboxylesterase
MNRALTLIALFVASTAPAFGQTARAVDGVPIRYEVRGKGEPALVFIHGYTSDRSAWREQVDVFAQRHLVVALDLGGHGESGANREKWTIPGLAGDVEAVIKALDLKRVVLIGHSMGGPVALFTAARMPDRVVGVIGVDTLHDVEFTWPPDQAKMVATMMEADFNGTLTGAIRSMFLETTDPALVKEVTAKSLRTDRKAALGLMQGFAELDLKAALAGAKKPVRTINAAVPRGGPPTAVEKNRKYGDYDAVLMEGVGHYPMLERPAEFNKHLQAVLDGLRGARR